MLYAMRVGLTMIVISVVFHMLLPTIASGMIEMVEKMIFVGNVSLDSVISALPNPSEEVYGDGEYVNVSY